MKYTIISEFANAKLTVETNDIRTACAEFLNRAEDADNTCICDGTTGEVLANTGDDPYCTDEFGLILLGYLMADAWNEDDDEEPAEEDLLAALDKAICSPLSAVMRLHS